jgi:hypothetical protein
MPRKTVQGGEAKNGNTELRVISDELRGWIDQVIVPILVKEFLRAEGFQEAEKDG